MFLKQNDNRLNALKTYTYSISRRIPFWQRVFSRQLPAKQAAFFFVVFSAALIISMLSLHNYMSKFVYVVMLDDREIGVIEDVKGIEIFMADLTDRCSAVYGMEMKPMEKINLVKDFRPDEIPDKEDHIRDRIRQQVTMTTDAYFIIVEGDPLVPVASKADLYEVIESLKALHIPNACGVAVLEVEIVEELDLIACSVPPREILTPEQIVSLLSNDSEANPPVSAAANNENGIKGDDNHKHAGFNEPHPQHFMEYGLNIITEAEAEKKAVVEKANAKKESKKEENGEKIEIGPDRDKEIKPEESQIVPAAAVSVKTVEEVTVTEAIPYPTEYVYDDEMWVVQKEVLATGQEGLKEMVYRVTRQNGAEIERVKISETVLKEPLSRVEVYGTANVPSVGSGQFLWPVQGGGEVSPGRGFSSWHTGIDICADTGTNVLAADNGVVWFSGYGGSQGNYLILYHGSYWTLYLHNSVNLASKGDRVTRGDVIAKVGSTGRSTGPHLHFEIRKDDGTGEWLGYYQHEPVDPLRFFNP